MGLLDEVFPKKKEATRLRPISSPSIKKTTEKSTRTTDKSSSSQSTNNPFFDSLKRVQGALSPGSKTKSTPKQDVKKKRPISELAVKSSEKDKVKAKDSKSWFRSPSRNNLKKEAIKLTTPSLNAVQKERQELKKRRPISALTETNVTLRRGQTTKIDVQNNLGDNLSRASSVTNLDVEQKSAKGARSRKSSSRDRIDKITGDGRKNDKKGISRNNNKIESGENSYPSLDSLSEEELQQLRRQLQDMAQEKTNLALQLGEQKGQLNILQKEIQKLKEESNIQLEHLTEENTALRNRLRDVAHSPLSDNEKQQLLFDSHRHHSSAPASIATNIIDDNNGADTTCTTPDWDKHSSSNVSEVSVACLQDKINQMQETHYSTNEELQATLQELTDLQRQLTELQQENERLNEEKTLMFDSLCRQTERLNDSRSEVESLKQLLYQEKDDTGQFESAVEREQKLVDLLKSAQEEREGLLVKLEQLNNELQESRSAVVEKGDQIGHLRERVRTLECTLDAKHAEHKLLDQELAQAKDQCSGKQIEINRLTDLLDNARTKINELEQDRTLSDKSELDELLDNARKEKDTLESEVAHLKEHLAISKNEIEKLKEQVSILQEECKVIRNNAKTTQSDLEYKCEKLQKDKNVLNDQLQEFQEALNELQVQSQCQLEDKRQLSAVLSETQRNLSEAERKNLTLENEVDEIKRLRAEENEEWEKFQDDLLTSVRVANDFKTEAQQELQRMILENKSYRDRERQLKAEIEKLKGATLNSEMDLLIKRPNKNKNKPKKDSGTLSRSDLPQTSTVKRRENKSLKAKRLKTLSVEEEMLLTSLNNYHAIIDKTTPDEFLTEEEKVIRKLKIIYEDDYLRLKPVAPKPKDQLAISKPLLDSVLTNPKLMAILKNPKVRTIEDMATFEKEAPEIRNLIQDIDRSKKGKSDNLHQPELKRISIIGRSMSCDHVYEPTLRLYRSNETEDLTKDVRHRSESPSVVPSDSASNYQNRYSDFSLVVNENVKYSTLERIVKTIPKNAPEAALTKEQKFAVKLLQALEERKNTLKKSEKAKTLPISTPTPESVLRNPKLKEIIHNPSIKHAVRRKSETNTPPVLEKVLRGSKSYDNITFIFENNRRSVNVYHSSSDTSSDTFSSAEFNVETGETGPFSTWIKPNDTPKVSRKMDMTTFGKSMDKKSKAQLLKDELSNTGKKSEVLRDQQQTSGGSKTVDSLLYNETLTKKERKVDLLQEKIKKKTKNEPESTKANKEVKVVHAIIETTQIPRYDQDSNILKNEFIDSGYKVDLLQEKLKKKTKNSTKNSKDTILETSFGVNLPQDDTDSLIYNETLTRILKREISIPKEESIKSIQKEESIKKPENEESIKNTPSEASVKIILNEASIKNIPNKEIIENIPKESIKKISKEENIKNIPTEENIRNIPKERSIKKIPEEESIKNISKQNINIPNEENIRYIRKESIKNIPKEETIKNIPKEENMKKILKEESINISKEENIKNIPKEESINKIPKEESIKNSSKEENIKNIPKEENIRNIPKEQSVQQILEQDSIKIISNEEIIENIPIEENIKNIPKVEKIIQEEETIKNIPEEESIKYISTKEINKTETSIAQEDPAIDESIKNITEKFQIIHKLITEEEPVQLNVIETKHPAEESGFEEIQLRRPISTEEIPNKEEVELRQPDLILDTKHYEIYDSIDDSLDITKENSQDYDYHAILKENRVGVTTPLNYRLSYKDVVKEIKEKFVEGDDNIEQNEIKVEEKEDKVEAKDEIKVEENVDTFKEKEDSVEAKDVEVEFRERSASIDKEMEDIFENYLHTRVSQLIKETEGKSSQMTELPIYTDFDKKLNDIIQSSFNDELDSHKSNTNSLMNENQSSIPNLVPKELIFSDNSYFELKDGKVTNIQVNEIQNILDTTRKFLEDQRKVLALDYSTIVVDKVVNLTLTDTISTEEVQVPLEITPLDTQVFTEEELDVVRRARNQKFTRPLSEFNEHDLELVRAMSINYQEDFEEPNTKENKEEEQPLTDTRITKDSMQTDEKEGYHHKGRSSKAPEDKSQDITGTAETDDLEKITVDNSNDNSISLKDITITTHQDMTDTAKNGTKTDDFVLNTKIDESVQKDEFHHTERSKDIREEITAKAKKEPSTERPDDLETLLIKMSSSKSKINKKVTLPETEINIVPERETSIKLNTEMPRDTTKNTYQEMTEEAKIGPKTDELDDGEVALNILNTEVHKSVEKGEFHHTERSKEITEKDKNEPSTEPTDDLETLLTKMSSLRSPMNIKINLPEPKIHIEKKTLINLNTEVDKSTDNVQIGEVHHIKRSSTSPEDTTKSTCQEMTEEAKIGPKTDDFDGNKIGIKISSEAALMKLNTEVHKSVQKGEFHHTERSKEITEKDKKEPSTEPPDDLETLITKMSSLRSPMNKKINLPETKIHIEKKTLINLNTEVDKSTDNVQIGEFHDIKRSSTSPEDTTKSTCPEMTEEAKKRPKPDDLVISKINIEISGEADLNKLNTELNHIEKSSSELPDDLETKKIPLLESKIDIEVVGEAALIKLNKTEQNQKSELSDDLETLLDKMSSYRTKIKPLVEHKMDINVPGEAIPIKVNAEAINTVKNLKTVDTTEETSKNQSRKITTNTDYRDNTLRRNREMHVILYRNNSPSKRRSLTLQKDVSQNPTNSRFSLNLTNDDSKKEKKVKSFAQHFERLSLERNKYSEKKVPSSEKKPVPKPRLKNQVTKDPVNDDNYSDDKEHEVFRKMSECEENFSASDHNKSLNKEKANKVKSGTEAPDLDESQNLLVDDFNSDSTDEEDGANSIEEGLIRKSDKFLVDQMPMTNDNVLESSGTYDGAKGSYSAIAVAGTAERLDLRKQSNITVEPSSLNLFNLDAPSLEESYIDATKSENKKKKIGYVNANYTGEVSDDESLENLPASDSKPKIVDFVPLDEATKPYFKNNHMPDYSTLEREKTYQILNAASPNLKITESTEKVESRSSFSAAKKMFQDLENKTEQAGVMRVTLTKKKSREVVDNPENESTNFKLDTKVATNSSVQLLQSEIDEI